MNAHLIVKVHLIQIPSTIIAQIQAILALNLMAQ